LAAFTGSVRAVNPILETWIIVSRELRKNFRSVKGIALLTLSVLGGAVLALAYAFIEQKKKEFGIANGEGLETMRQNAYMQLYGDEAMAKYLAPSSEGLAFSTYVSFWLLPLLIAIVGFDGISGEVQHRSVRFWTARSRKTSYYAGKVVGLWLTIVGMLLVTHVIVWIVLVIFGASSASAIFGWGVRYFVTIIPTAAAWTSVAVLVASQFRAPLVSLLSVCALFFVMFVSNVGGGLYTAIQKAKGNEGAKNFVNYIYPSAYDSFLLHPSPAKWGMALGLCFAFVIVCGGLGMAIFQKRDV
jgi:ABC-type transport system involved in multi-copper enzyme maturation permease subunit